MTPEEIRTEVTERLARAEYMKDREIIPDMLGMTTPPPVWEDATDAARQEHRRFVGHLVDALGDMLPTERESRFVGLMNDGRSRHVRRYLTAWTEIIG